MKDAWILNGGHKIDQFDEGTVHGFIILNYGPFLHCNTLLVLALLTLIPFYKVKQQP